MPGPAALPPVAEVIADPGSESGAGPIHNPVAAQPWIPGRARDDKLPVIADPGSESGAGPIRNPVSVWHWIPGRARDDKWRPGMTSCLSLRARSAIQFRCGTGSRVEPGMTNGDPG